MAVKTFKSEMKNFLLQNFTDLNEIVSFHKYNKGQTIFYEGHMPYGLFILTSGEVEIKYSKSNIEKIKKPALLGISAFINKTYYSGTAKAITNCEIYFLSTSSFLNLFNEKHPFVEIITSIN